MTTRDDVRRGDGEAHESTDGDDDLDDAEATDSKRKGKSKGKIKFESVMQRGEAVAYFGALVDGLRHGRLQFRHAEEHLSLEPAEQVSVEVKASKKGDKERVAFEIEWRRAEQDRLEVTNESA
jgi:amphi-Trp domain-containing protein